MEDLYILGWLAAFAMGFTKMIMGLSSYNSLRMRNLRKIDYYFNPFTGQFQTSPVSFGFLVFYVIYLIGIAPLFSWLSFLSGAWTWIAAWTNRVELPERIKEIQFKIATVELSKIEVLKYYNEILKIQGLPPVQSTQTQIKNIYETNNFGWHTRYEIDALKMQIFYQSNTPEYDSIFNTTYEYKIENNSIFSRTIEDSVDNYGKIVYHIKDNVVLESNIRMKCEENKLFDYEDQCHRFNQLIKWNKVEICRLRFSIMSLHPEIFPETEVRKIARSELERIKLGRFNFEKAAREVGCTWFEEDGYTRFLLPDNCDEKAKIEIKELFNEESILTYNITRNELYSFLEITNYLSEFLGDKKAAA